MTKTSRVSKIFSILSSLRIVPGLKNVWSDWVGAILWMFMVSLGTVGRIYQGYDYLVRIDGVADKITAVIMTLLIPLYMFLTFPLLAIAVGKTSDLIKKSDLPGPEKVVLFSILVITKSLIVFYSVYLEINSDQSLGSTVGFCMLMYAICTLVLHFVVGVAAKNFKQKVEEAHESQVGAILNPLTVSENLIRKAEEAQESCPTPDCTYNPLIQEFQDMKEGFGPLLFLFYTVKCVLLISFSYEFGKSLLNSWIAGVTCLELAYVTFVLDDVFINFKNISEDLR